MICRKIANCLFWFTRVASNLMVPKCNRCITCCLIPNSFHESRAKCWENLSSSNSLLLCSWVITCHQCQYSFSCALFKNSSADVRAFPCDPLLSRLLSQEEKLMAHQHSPESLHLVKEPNWGHKTFDMQLLFACDVIFVIWWQRTWTLIDLPFIGTFIILQGAALRCCRRAHRHVR